MYGPPNDRVRIIFIGIIHIFLAQHERPMVAATPKTQIKHVEKSLKGHKVIHHFISNFKGRLRFFFSFLIGSNKEM